MKTSIPSITGITVLDDGGGVVSVYIDFDFNAPQTVIDSPTICMLAERKHVQCAFAHPVTPPYRCEKCDPDGALVAAWNRQSDRRGHSVR